MPGDGDAERSPWDAAEAAARIAAPAEPPTDPPVRVKASLQAAVSRLIRPFLTRQRAIDEELLSGLQHLQQELEGIVLRTNRLTIQTDRLDDRLERHADRHAARPYMTEPWTQWNDPQAGLVEGFETGAMVPDRNFYSSFEHRFRGTRERILELQRPYVEMLRGRGPVLDCGCGRGELLELLGEASIEASGVDLDSGMLAEAHQLGLSVCEDDALDKMDQLPAGTLGAIVAMQVIEHLPEPQLVAFFHLARKALRPGGRLIVETVNPHSMQALNAFWLDPTHRHPLFPDVVLELCRSAGFDQGFVMHPGGVGDVERDRRACPAYAVVADVSSSAA